MFVAGEMRDMADVEALVREALAARAARQPRLAMPAAEKPLGTLEQWRDVAKLPKRVVVGRKR